MAKCTVLGHSNCSVTCPNGCIADWVNGECKTYCTKAGDFQLDPKNKHTITINEVFAVDLGRAMGDCFDEALRRKVSDSEAVITLTIENATLEVRPKRYH